MPLDHIGLTVPPSKYDEVVSWYLAALAPLGYTKRMDFGVACGLGDSPTSLPFWIAQKESVTSGDSLHVAFSAKDHATVDQFHEEALKAGGKDNGKPGLRTNYHPNYYGAFVFDPMG